MIKKLSIFLAIVLMFVSPIQAFAQEQQYFSDMPKNWSTEALTKAVAHGLMSGYNGRLYPEKSLNGLVLWRNVQSSRNGNIPRI